MSWQVTTAPLPPEALNEFSNTTAEGLCFKMKSAGSICSTVNLCQWHFIINIHFDSHQVTARSLSTNSLSFAKRSVACLHAVKWADNDTTAVECCTSLQTIKHMKQGAEAIAGAQGLPDLFRVPHQIEQHHCIQASWADVVVVRPCHQVY